MKFNVSTSVLLKQLQNLGGVISNNTVIPILQDFLMILEGNLMTIVATDLETTMSTQINLEGEENGKVAIPAKIVLDILKMLPDQPLSIHIDNETLAVTINTQNGVYKLAGENPEDFPEPPPMEETDEISIPVKVVKRAIDNTLFAVSNDELRPQMTGVFFDFAEDKLTWVATDAHKLVKYVRNGIENISQNSFIVPKKALNLLKNVLPSDSEEEISISYNGKNVFFAFEGVKLASRLIEGRYPDYNTVIPRDNDNILSLERGDLLNAVKRISLFSSKTTYQVVLSVKKDMLSLYAQDRDFSNEASESMPCQYEGEPMDIAFNARFLLDILNALESDQISFKLSNPNRPTLVVPGELFDEEEIVMLLMPMILNN